MITILAPLQGWVSPLDEVPDEVFSGRILGDGVAIDPVGATVFAPCDGVVANLAKHAVMVRAACGAEILIHVGLETVALAGRGFTARVKEGQAVKAGDPLLDFDLGFLASRVKSLISPVVIANGDAFRIVRCTTGRETRAGDVLFELEAVATTRAAAQGGTAVRDVVITAAHGLHARPAALIAAAAKPFQSEIVASLGKRKANARSAMALMALTARAGDRMTLTATGPDAQAAIDALAQRIATLADEPSPVLPVAAPKPDISGTILHGIGAAPGIALGPLLRLHAADLAVAEQGQGLSHETAELHRAVSAVKARLEQAAQRDIAAAHIALLEDSELHQAALHDIEQGKSAGFAWRRAVRAYAGILRAADDERLRERAGDLLDLERQVLAALAGKAPKPQLPQGVILVAEEILPSDLMGAAGLAGIVSVRGGPTSHVAILAAGMGIPALVGLSDKVLGAEEGRDALLDADQGLLDLAPGDTARQKARDAIARARHARDAAQAAASDLCRTADRARLEVFANLGKSAQEATDAVRLGAEGCGLLRTEFLFLDRAAPPSEEEQYAQYQGIADALDGRELILRTFDIGADKPAPYLSFPHEDNPALGIRGIRAALLWPDLLSAQLRAAARINGRVKIMLPMVIAAEEIAAVRQVLVDICAGLGRPCPPLGIMIETPASAVLADQLVRQADFLSIGTNDLTQYVLAIDRGHRDLGARLDALHPAVLRLIARAAEAANAAGKPVGVCGGLAADPLAAALLVGLGIGELSVPAAAIPQLKAAIRKLRRDVCRAVADEALTLDSAAAVRALVRSRLT